jgi:hypothetical protein
MPDLPGPVAMQYLVVLDIDHWEVQDISWRTPIITGGAVEAQAVGLVQKPLEAAAWKAFLPVAGVINNIVYPSF